MADSQKKKVLVSVKHLVQTFNAGKKDEVKAIQDISFDIYEGETSSLAANVNGLSLRLRLLTIRRFCSQMNRPRRWM